MTHDSLVTVRLSESSSSTTLVTAISSNTNSEQPSPSTTDRSSNERDSPQSTHRDSSLTFSPTATSLTLQSELGGIYAEDHESDSSEDSDEVNWEQLERTEDEQVKDDETDNVGPHLLNSMPYHHPSTC